MKKKDYTALIYHHIPNEKKYHFIFPLHILNKYNGPDNLDITLDDYLIYFIIEPILRNQIEYHFELVWKDKDNNKSDYLNICVKVNDEMFNPKIVIDNLTTQKMIAGLQLYKEEHEKLNKIYG